MIWAYHNGPVLIATCGLVTFLLLLLSSPLFLSPTDLWLSTTSESSHPRVHVRGLPVPGLGPALPGWHWSWVQLLSTLLTGNNPTTPLRVNFVCPFTPRATQVH
ncbi:hypothetical protein F4775DRAFT_200622 [Biscogniauxia sp. FL1348]|nr:hypothetical protein F4775DRAFT_200622 [Biscogniauxia sp. FL1348]